MDLLMEAFTANKNANYPLAMDKLNSLLIESPSPIAWNLRGSILEKLGHPFDAIMNYDKAILLQQNAAYYNNRGVSYLSMNRLDNAIADFNMATILEPKLAEAYNNIGNTYRKMGRANKAIEAYRKATIARPDYVDSHLGLSFSLLECGEFEEGWKEFEWRWKSDQMVPRGLPYPEWNGEMGDGGLLLYAEQGFGDALQFMRYAALAKELWVGSVYVEVKQPLMRLSKTLKGIDGVVTLGEPIPKDVTHCAALMSLPRIMKTRVETIPGECPYLFADSYRTGIWKERLKALPPGFLVGLCWAGMSRPLNPIADSVDQARSMTLGMFSSIAKVSGVSWVSLQHGIPSKQVKTPPHGMTILDATEEMYDFYDTAAMIECLDLVITVDTSVAHLAGALGKPVWMLSRFDGCWRWLGDRKDSPWYPTLTQFKQKKLGEWDSVLEEVKTELSSFTRKSLAA